MFCRSKLKIASIIQILYILYLIFTRKLIVFMSLIDTHYWPMLYEYLLADITIPMLNIERYLATEQDQCNNINKLNCEVCLKITK